MLVVYVHVPKGRHVGTGRQDEIAFLLQRLDLLPWRGGHHLNLTRQKRVDPGRWVGQFHDDQLVKLGMLTPIGVISLKHDVYTLVSFHKTEGTSSCRVKGHTFIAVFFDRGRTHDQELAIFLDRPSEPLVIWLLQGKADGLRVDNLEFVEPHRQVPHVGRGLLAVLQGLRIGDPLDIVFYGVGIERCAVVEVHALAQLERPDLPPFRDFVGLRQRRFQLGVGCIGILEVQHQQAFKNLARDGASDPAAHGVRVEGVGFGRRGPDQRSS